MERHENTWQTLRSFWKNCSPSSDRERLFLLRWVVILEQRNKEQMSKIKKLNESLIKPKMTTFQRKISSMKSSLYAKDVRICLKSKAEKMHILNYLRQKKISSEWFLFLSTVTNWNRNFFLMLKLRKCSESFWETEPINRTLVPGLEKTWSFAKKHHRTVFSYIVQKWDEKVREMSPTLKSKIKFFLRRVENQDFLLD
jgi:hypothetical protein